MYYYIYYENSNNEFCLNFEKMRSTIDDIMATLANGTFRSRYVTLLVRPVHWPSA